MLNGAEDAVRTEKHRLLIYMKKAEVNSDMVLGVLVTENGNQKLITEQR